MHSVSKSELKAKILEYLRKVERTGEELIITDNRIPVLKVVPIKKGTKTRDIFAKYQKSVGDVKDVLSPTTSDWEGELP